MRNKNNESPSASAEKTWRSQTHTRGPYSTYTHGIINKQETLEHNQERETKQEYGNQNLKMRAIKIARHTWKHRNRQGCYISTINVKKSIVKGKHQTDRSNPFHPTVSARTNLQLQEVSHSLTLSKTRMQNRAWIFFRVLTNVQWTQKSKCQTLLYGTLGFLVGLRVLENY